MNNQFNEAIALAKLVAECPDREQGWTGEELKKAFPTIKLPSKSKVVAAAFRHAGYLSGNKREGSVIWRKP